MANNNPSSLPPSSDVDPSPQSEGGLRAPPGLSSLGKVWWWFHFLILVKLARLRFIAILVIIGLMIVKWDLLAAYYQKWTRPASVDKAASSDVEYFCPMHPTVIRDHAKEKCPICFMPLSRRKKGETKEEALPPGIVNRVQLSPYRVVLAGIQTWKVSYQPLTKEITTVGFVEFSEREMKQVAARVKGRIDTLTVNETGQFVDADAELACLYSPDLVVTVQNLIDAAKPNGNLALLQSAKDRLKLWGIDDKQVKEILDSGMANTHLKIRSPIRGYVIKKYVKEGQYVDEGTPLYDVADVAKVWIQAQVYEDDMAFIPSAKPSAKEGKDLKEDLPVTATTRAFPMEKFHGRLTFVYPHVDQDTRTVIVRFEVKNPDYKLRPGTSATVKLKIPPKKLDLFERALTEDRKLLLAKGLLLAVPDSAVIDTGTLQIVYRELTPGEYEGVKVELGPRMQGPKEVTYYPVLRGLDEGDVVVTSGSFLVDAETRLNPAAGSIYFGGSGSSKSGASVSLVKPSTPEDQETKIKVALGKLSESDRLLAEAQAVCPVLKDSPLGSMGVPVKLMIQDQPVFLCCKGCEKGALVNPKKTLDEVSKLKAAGQAK